jgi:hypothetical protein
VRGLVGADSAERVGEIHLDVLADCGVQPGLGSGPDLRLTLLKEGQLKSSCPGPMEST